MNKRGSLLLGLLALTALVFVSCDSFFSETWGSGRSYDPDNINLTASNLDSWIENSIGNPGLAAALTAKIKEEVKSKPDSPERLVFQEKGVELAIEASGIGASILSNAANVLGDLSDIDDMEEEEIKDAVKDILTNIQSDFSSGGPQAAANLAEIVTVSIKDQETLSHDDTPAFEDSSLYAANAQAGDVGEAVLVLALAVFGTEDSIRDNIENLSEGGEAIAGLTLDSDSHKIKIDTSDGEPVPEAIALAAYLNLIAADGSERFDDNPITKAIKEAFGLAAD